MILKVNRAEFLKRLRIVEKAISENKIRPIISCVFMETKNNMLFFCGTNLELTITTSMGCEITEEGKAVFQHQLVDEYLKEITDEFININIQGDILTIETADSASEFSLMNAEDFPRMVGEFEDRKEKSFTLNKTKLSEIFEKIKFSASASSDNLSINCIRVEIENNIMKFISTDTYRLTYLEQEIEQAGELKVSIPLNTVEALNKLLKVTEEENVDISFTNKQLCFMIDNISVVSRVIDLPFPNYKGILGATGYNKRLLIEADEFTKILKRIQIFVKNNVESRYGAIFELNSDRLEIRGVNDLAKVKEEAIVNYNGEDIKISLNVKFLLDFIQNMGKDKKILMEFTTSNSAVRMKDSIGDNYIYIVMPLALKDF